MHSKGEPYISPQETASRFVYPKTNTMRHMGLTLSFLGSTKRHAECRREIEFQENFKRCLRDKVYARECVYKRLFSFAMFTSIDVIRVYRRQ